MWLALVGPDLLSVLAVVALLLGVPVFVVVVLAVVSGYIQHDAERRLAELEDASRDHGVDESEDIEQ